MQTVSFAGSTYNIPNTRGDRPWSGLSDFVIAAASKCINTGGGNFTLLANINFGATFGLVSAFYTSRTASAADAGQLRLANTDTIKWRNGLDSANLSLAIATNRLTFEGSRLIIAGAAEIVNADVSASAAIAYSKLAALTVSRVPQTNAATGFLEVSSVTNTELGYVSGVTSAIQTQLNAKGAGTVTSVSGTANQIGVATGTTTPVISIASPLTLPGAMTAGGAIAMATNKITGLGAATTNGDAVRYEQLQAKAGLIAQMVQGTTTSATTTSSTTYTDTALTATITPGSASSKIKITCHGTLTPGNANSNMFVTIARGGAALSGVNGFSSTLQNGTTSIVVPWAAVYLDAPASTSATVYTVRIKSESGTSISFNPGTQTAVILLEEVLQ